MRSLFFGFILLTIQLPINAQGIRGSNTQITNSGTVASRNTPFLIDKNNYLNPDFFTNGFKKNNQINLAARSQIFPIFAFTPDSNFSEIISLKGVNNIKLIDARFDTEKIGFLPVGNELKKNGYIIIGIQIHKDLLNWLTEGFINKQILTNDSSSRQLVIVIEKLRISNNAVEHYTVSNPKLLTTLQYQFAVFSSIGSGYYPQKKISGNISTLFNNGSALKYLTDSILSKLKIELANLSFTAKERETNWQSPVDFNDYYNSRFRKVSNIESRPKGVYATYQDFINSEPICDSVEMIRKFNNYERASMYACILSGYKDGLPISCNRC